MTMSGNIRDNPNAGRWMPLGPALAAYAARQQALEKDSRSQDGIRATAAKTETRIESSRNSGAAAKASPRALAARTKLGTAFLEALQSHFAEHGEAAIAKVFEQNPYQYLRIIAALMPKVLPRENGDLEDMNDEQIRELLGAIRHVRARGHGASAAGSLGPCTARQ
jgi:hypothetical protein